MKCKIKIGNLVLYEPRKGSLGQHLPSEPFIGLVLEVRPFNNPVYDAEVSWITVRWSGKNRNCVPYTKPYRISEVHYKDVKVIA